VAGTCECGNEPSGSIKCGEFLDCAENWLASEERLCCMELLDYSVGLFVSWLIS
jgi:hypothetical protein